MTTKRHSANINTVHSPGVVHRLQLPLVQQQPNNNMLGRNRKVRIHQAPPGHYQSPPPPKMLPHESSSSSSSNYNRRSYIPSSVEFVKGTSRSIHPNEGEGHHLDHNHPTGPSEPIPITRIPPTSQELEDQARSADSTSQYDWATWKMYALISAARGCRAVALSSATCGSGDYTSRRLDRMLNHQQQQDSSSQTSVGGNIYSSSSHHHHHHEVAGDIMTFHNSLPAAAATADEDANHDGVFALDML